MAVRVDDELCLTADGVQQKTRFFAGRGRIARQGDGHEGAEKIVVIEMIGRGSRIAGETPDVPIGEARRGADVLIMKGDESGIVAHDSERGARHVVVLTRMVSSRIDRANLGIGTQRGGEAEGDECRTGYVALKQSHSFLLTLIVGSNTTLTIQSPGWMSSCANNLNGYRKAWGSRQERNEILKTTTQCHRCQSVSSVVVFRLRLCRAVKFVSAAPGFVCIIAR